MSPFVTAVSGSPSARSKTACLVDHVLHRLTGELAGMRHIRLADLDGAALLQGRFGEPGLATAASAIAQADGVIIATPIFKASFSGLLKSFLDGLPQFALAGKTVLPLATGGSPAHVLALDYGLRPVLQSMGARHIVQGVFVNAAQIETETDGCRLAPDCETMLAEAVLHFRHALRAGFEGPALLGHPRPERQSDASLHPQPIFN